MSRFAHSIMIALAGMVIAASTALADKEVGVKKYTGDNGPAAEAFYIAETEAE